MLGRPGIERERLGAFHVRIEAAEPEQAGRAPSAGAHGDAARRIVLADLDKDRFSFVCREISHGTFTLVLSFEGAPAITSRTQIST